MSESHQTPEDGDEAVTREDALVPTEGPEPAASVSGPDEQPANESPPEDAAEDPAVTLDSRLEAVLFSSDLPLTVQRLRSLLGGAQRDVVAAIDRLNVFYGETNRAFRIVPLAGGFQLVTIPEFATLLGRLHKERVPTRLSRAALETLSIIAFKQPVTRGEVDAIRGVSASDRVLRHLIDRKLVRISGRAEAPGRPLLYGTTREFLGYFGLSAVSDLPRTDELEALLAGDVPAPAAEGDEDQELALGMEAPVGEADGSELPATELPAETPESETTGMTLEEAALEEDSLDDDEELFDESEATLESHSGEESDDHEGIPAPQ